MADERLSIPTWAVRLFGLVQAVVLPFLAGMFWLMWDMNQQVAVLNVKMEIALRTDGKLDILSERLNILSGRLTRMEAMVEKRSDEVVRKAD